MTKKKFIQELIEAAQANIWKNELALAYKEAGNQSEADPEKVKFIIERDTAYIKFLENELQNSK